MPPTTRPRCGRPAASASLRRRRGDVDAATGPRRGQGLLKRIEPRLRGQPRARLVRDGRHRRHDRGCRVAGRLQELAGSRLAGHAELHVARLAGRTVGASGCPLRALAGALDLAVDLRLRQGRHRRPDRGGRGWADARARGPAAGRLRSGAGTRRRLKRVLRHDLKVQYRARGRNRAPPRPGLIRRSRMPHPCRAVDQGWRAVRRAAPASAAGPAHARVTFLGHSTLLIEVDRPGILTDPILRDGVGPIRRQVKAVLPELFADLEALFISHGHHDTWTSGPCARSRASRRSSSRAGSARPSRSSRWVPWRRWRPATGCRSTASTSRSFRAPLRQTEPIGPEGPAIGCVIAGSKTVYFAATPTSSRRWTRSLTGSTSPCCPCGLGRDDRSRPHGPGAPPSRGLAAAEARHPHPLGHSIRPASGAGSRAVRDARPAVRGGGRRARPRGPVPAAGPGESVDLDPS